MHFDKDLNRVIAPSSLMTFRIRFKLKTLILLNLARLSPSPLAQGFPMRLNDKSSLRVWTLAHLVSYLPSSSAPSSVILLKYNSKSIEWRFLHSEIHYPSAITP